MFILMCRGVCVFLFVIFNRTYNTCAIRITYIVGVLKLTRFLIRRFVSTPEKTDGNDKKKIRDNVCGRY